MRTAEINRTTAETAITLRLCLDGTGASQVQSGVGFLDHMLTLFAKHSRFDLTLTCSGDTKVDDHHSVEDIGIVLGQALCQALGDKRGIRRYGSCILPMDEALILCAADLSGRSCLRCRRSFQRKRSGHLTRSWWKNSSMALTREARM